MHKLGRTSLALLSSLWFVPGLIVLGAIALALTLVEIDQRFAAVLAERMPQLFAASAEGSRTMLSTIAGSMITVAGVTFSITIVTLSLAASQYSPRILRNFMGNRASQVVLGTFVGVFAYCLVVLRTVRGGDEIAFVPSISVFVGFLLALVGVGVLVFFIHHIASSIQASTILETIELETRAAIERLFPDEVGDDEAEVDPRAAEYPREWFPLAARRSGYLQDVDEDGLLAFALRHGLVVRIEHGIGEFVIEGSPVLSVSDARALDPGAWKKLAGLASVGPQRTIEQDVGFGLRQIDDIALRALSPGINDTTTALACVDRVASVLAAYASRRIPSRARYDAGRLCVLARRRGFEEALERAIGPLRRAAEGNTAVLSRLIDALAAIRARARGSDRRRAVEAQLERLGEAIERTLPAEHDRRELERRRLAVFAG